MSGRAAIANRVAIPNVQNLLLQSQTLDSASWGKSNASVSANTTTAPDGTLTADSLIEDATPAVSHSISQTGSGTMGGGFIRNTLSLFAQANTRIWLLLLGNAGNSIVWVNVSTNAIGTISSNCTCICEAASLWIAGAAADWKRIYFTFPFVTSFNSVIRLSTGDGVSSYNGDGTSGMYLWGIQLTQSNWPGNYALTVGSTVDTGPIRSKP